MHTYSPRSQTQSSPGNRFNLSAVPQQFHSTQDFGSPNQNSTGLSPRHERAIVEISTVRKDFFPHSRSRASRQTRHSSARTNKQNRLRPPSTGHSKIPACESFIGFG